MEGMAWILFVAYNIIGCFYYCFSIRRIVSFIKNMRAGYMEGGITISILLMTLIVAWPYYVWLDLKSLED